MCQTHCRTSRPGKHSTKAFVRLYVVEYVQVVGVRKQLLANRDHINNRDIVPEANRLCWSGQSQNYALHEFDLGKQIQKTLFQHIVLPVDEDVLGREKPFCRDDMAI